jgi:uncharacterized RDD family membrane protein YckC
VTCAALAAVAPVVPAIAGAGYVFWLPLLAGPVALAYFTLCHGSRRGQTLGDHVLDIAVRNVDGGRASYGQAFGRTLVIFAFATFWFAGGALDFLWPLWDRRRQAWHDKIAETVVVKTSTHT